LGVARERATPLPQDDNHETDWGIDGCLFVSVLAVGGAGVRSLVLIWETWGNLAKPGDRRDVHRFLGKPSDRDKAGLSAIGDGFPGPPSLSWDQRTRSQLLKGLHEILTSQWTPGVRGVPQYVPHLSLVANKMQRSFVGSRSLCERLRCLRMTGALAENSGAPSFFVLHFDHEDQGQYS
jgi:hypothetical protein